MDGNVSARRRHLLLSVRLVGLVFLPMHAQTGALFWKVGPLFWPGKQHGPLSLSLANTDWQLRWEDGYLEGKQKAKWPQCRPMTPGLLPPHVHPTTHHAVPVVSPVPIEVGQVAVLVPPGATVAQGAVAQGDVIVRVDGSPGLALVVGHGIAWNPSTLVSHHEHYFVLTIVLHQSVPWF